MEGSRFGGCLVTLATFGPITGPAQTYENRRLPRTTQRFAVLSAGRERIEDAAGQSVTLGYSREPPAATFFGRIGNWEQNTQGGEIRVKSGSPPDFGRSHTSSTLPARPTQFRPSICPMAQAACSAIRASESPARSRKTGKSSSVPTFPSATQTLRTNRFRFIRLIGECRKSERNSS